MAKTLTQLINDYQDRSNQLPDAAVSSFNDTSEDWVDLIRDQRRHGLAGDGDVIGYYASPIYAEVKHRMNPLAGDGIVDLKVTGSFEDAGYAIAKQNKIITTSSDWKNNELEKKYGSRIHGITVENKKIYIFGPYWSVLKKKLDL